MKTLPEVLRRQAVTVFQTRTNSPNNEGKWRRIGMQDLLQIFSADEFGTKIISGLQRGKTVTKGSLEFRISPNTLRKS